MKKTLLFTLLILNAALLFGQNAYIEVKGEPDLSIYLNNKFQGKTSAEFNVLIVENVVPGQNLIKIVKEGFVPFEETITVKPGEVLAYKVKPFTKHKVYVSEEGNTAESDKKAIVTSGKLVVQSVPIEIAITIPSIEGINKSPKTKDKWLVDEIPTGSYEITFVYNQKVITETIEIIENETTSLFVNMLSGDFKMNNTLDEKVGAIRFIDSLQKVYKYKDMSTEREFRILNPEAFNALQSKEILDEYTFYYEMNDEFLNDAKFHQKKIGVTKNIVFEYELELRVYLNDYPTLTADSFSKLHNEVKKNVSTSYYKYSVNQYGTEYLSVFDPRNNSAISITLDKEDGFKNKKDHYSSLRITFNCIQTINPPK